MGHTRACSWGSRKTSCSATFSSMTCRQESLGLCSVTSTRHVTATQRPPNATTLPSLQVMCALMLPAFHPLQPLLFDSLAIWMKIYLVKSANIQQWPTPPHTYCRPRFQLPAIAWVGLRDCLGFHPSFPMTSLVSLSTIIPPPLEPEPAPSTRPVTSVDPHTSSDIHRPMHLR